MSMNPNKLAFMRQTDFIPVTNFTGLSAEPTITILGGDAPSEPIGVDGANDEGLSKTDATDRTGITGVQPMRSWGAGNPVLSEISTTGLPGLLMAAAGDDVAHFMRIPSKWDRNFPIYVRVVWTSSHTGAVVNETLEWKFLYLAYSANSGIAIPSIALDTVLVTQAPSTTIRGLVTTANGKINAETFTTVRTHMSFLVEMQAFHGDLGEDKWLLGVEFEYTPRFGRGRNQREGRAWENYQFGT